MTRPMTTIRRPLCVAVAAVLLSACATNYATRQPGEVAAMLKVQESEFSTDRLFVAPDVRGEGQGLFAPLYSVRLIGVQDKRTLTVQHALVADWTYVGRGWIFFSRATLSGAVELPTKRGRTDVSCGGSTCTYRETTTSAVSQAVLESRRAGLRVQFGGAGANVVVDIPGAYVEGYLEGLRARSTARHD